MKRMPMLLLLATLSLAGCEPEVGSAAWCEKMEKKDKVDWTAREAADYMKYCVLKQERE